MRILHVFRSPVGGLFRHVRDLARGQAGLGHHVGLYCDSSTGGAGAQTTLAACSPFCAGGIVSQPIARLPSATDVKVVSDVLRHAKAGQFDIIHGHGAKGGLVARLVGRRLGLPSVYSPHGGSLHYSWTSPSGAAFLATEKLLGRIGSGFVFVCEHEKRLFDTKIGIAGKPCVVAHNGLWPDEFEPLNPAPGASDVVFVGEVRHLKGVDLLLHAIRTLPQVSLTVVGDGPELDSFKALSQSLGLAGRVRFAGRLPIREALTQGRIMAVPSRHESFPYVVLETAAAAVPMVATAVGGIPEVLPPHMLCQPDAAELANAVKNLLDDLPAARRQASALASGLRDRFTVQAMAGTITAFYGTLQR